MPTVLFTYVSSHEVPVGDATEKQLERFVAPWGSSLAHNDLLIRGWSQSLPLISEHHLVLSWLEWSGTYPTDTNVHASQLPVCWDILNRFLLLRRMQNKKSI